MKVRRGSAVAVTLAATLALSACGSRVSGDEVLAGAGGGTVRLDEASIAELGKVTGGNGVVAPAESSAGASTAAADAAPGTGASTGVVNPKPGVPGTLATGAAQPAIGRQAAAANKAGADTTNTGAAAGPATCTGPGLPLKLGQVGAFSGVSGPITANARTALAAWVQDVNARGGIACHPVQLFAADDGGDPAKASALVQRLVQEKGVQAIVGVFDPLGFKGILSAVEKLKIPVIGGDALDFAWNESPYVFPTGATILGVVRGAIKQTIAAGKTKVGLLYCVEASVCTNSAKIIPTETEKAGGKILYSAAISLTQPDFTAQCQAAKNAGVEAMGMAMDGSSIARVARSCSSINYHPQFVTNGLVLSPQNAEDPQIRKNTLSSSSPVAPWTGKETPGQQAYHAALAKYAPNSLPSGNSISAWAAGKMVEAVVGKLGAAASDKPITTADLMIGLGKISKETLGGLTPPFSFKPGQKFAPSVDCVYFTLLSEKGWTAPRGNKPVCF